MDTIQSLLPKEELTTENYRYIQGFSIGALTYNCLYFKAMKDTPLAVVTLICAIIPIGWPLLIIVSFVARRRAWERREWLNFEEFETAQKGWDNAGWIGLVLGGLLLYAAYRIIMSSLSSAGLDNINSLQSVQQQIKELTNP